MKCCCRAPPRYRSWEAGAWWGLGRVGLRGLDLVFLAAQLRGLAQRHPRRKGQRAAVVPCGAQQLKAPVFHAAVQHTDAEVLRDLVRLGNACGDDVVALLAQPLVGLPFGVVPQVLQQVGPAGLDLVHSVLQVGGHRGVAHLEKIGPDRKSVV